jgi:hypothetical protein
MAQILEDNKVERFNLEHIQYTDMTSIDDVAEKWGGSNPEDLSMDDLASSEEYRVMSMDLMDETPFELYESRYPTGARVFVNREADEIILRCSKSIPAKTFTGFCMGYLYRD